MSLSHADAANFLSMMKEFIVEEKLIGEFIGEDALILWAENYFYGVFNSSKELETYIADNYEPGEIFKLKDLRNWAENNGFVQE